MWYNLYISRESLILVKQKEKEKLFFGNKSAKRLVFLLVFLVCGFFIFNFNSFDFNSNKAQAQTETEKKCTDEDMESLRKECKCTSQDCRPNRPIANRYDTDYYTAEEIAILRCYNTSVQKKCDETITTDVQLGQGVSNYDVEAYREEVKKASPSAACSKFGDVGCWLLWAFNSLLYGIFKLMGAIVVIAGNIFDWVINADHFDIVMNISAINQGWKMVRDFLNLFFILILLFSAFCTIFQVTKYHIKTILLNLVIMALLVNFSYPISRAIIDAGNIPMYYFFQAIGGNGTGSIGKMLWDDANGNAGLQMFLLPSIESSNAINGQSDQTFSLVAAIIFIFLFGITLLVIAVLFLIRMLVLAILVIFSPVGFVAAIFPGFSKYSSSWWEQLFKQSFFGTVMAFMLYLSLLIMKDAQSGVIDSMAKASTSDSGVFGRVVVGGVTLAIPIALLWIGVLSAQNMGAFGAKAVVGRATRFAGWAGRAVRRGLGAVTGVNFARRQIQDYQRERQTRVEEARFRPGRNIGRRVNDTQDTIMASLGSQEAQRRMDRRRQTRSREDVHNRVQVDGRDGNTLIMDPNGLNANIDIALDPNTAGNVKREHAVTAQSVRNLADTELRLIVENNAAAFAGSIGSGNGIFGNIAAGSATANSLVAIRTGVHPITGAPPNADDYNRVVGHLRTRAGEVYREGILHG